MKTKEEIAEILEEELANLGCDNCKLKYNKIASGELICNRCEELKLVWWKLSEQKAYELAERILE